MKLRFRIIAAVLASGAVCGAFAACKRTEHSQVDPLSLIRLDENGRLTYEKNTRLSLDVGHRAGSNKERRIIFTGQQMTQASVLPDGKIYQSGMKGLYSQNALKPVWRALEELTGLQFVDNFSNEDATVQITQQISGKTLGERDIITGQSVAIVNNSEYFVDLSDYLDYMPNFKQFLQSNPVALYSLTGGTAGKKAGAIYYAPYFDGNADVEKYTLMHRDWVKKLLDEPLADGKSVSFANQLAAKGLAYQGTLLTAHMGGEDWQVQTTNPADTAQTLPLKVSYSSALNAVKNPATPLGAAYLATGTQTPVEALENGNIVTVMNAVIGGTNGQVTGAQLCKLLREYVAITYQNADGTPFYSTLSDVFISAWAAWDADLLVALYRCVVTCPQIIAQNAKTEQIYGLTARENRANRRNDLLSFLGELYGVRGLASRLENTYIDADGALKDARLNTATYEALAKGGAMVAEGLLYGGNDYDLKAENYIDKSTQAPKKEYAALSYWDYTQTQTVQGLKTDVKGVDYTNFANYNLAPVVTCVSKWDTDGDKENGNETIMRFTESYRSVKNTGFALVKSSLTADKNKLSAALAFVDTVFSPDGQLLMTYGPQSKAGNVNPDGWWYAQQKNAQPQEIADLICEKSSYLPYAQYQIKPEFADDYFIYEEKVYRGFLYNGTQVPIPTDASRQQFAKGGYSASAYNYTDYARGVIGSTLPIGNKNQGLEYQLTANCALDGANNVGIAMQNGTLMHLQHTPESGKLWYLCVPTTLPLTPALQTTLAQGTQTALAEFFSVHSDVRMNALMKLAYYGFNGKEDISSENSAVKMFESGAAYVNWYQGLGGTMREAIYNRCWQRLKTYYGIEEQNA